MTLTKMKRVQLLFMLLMILCSQINYPQIKFGTCSREVKKIDLIPGFMKIRENILKILIFHLHSLFLFQYNFILYTNTYKYIKLY